MQLEWTKNKDYLCATTKNFKFEKKLAMFDLDSTLIKPKIGKNGNGKGFPVDANDWVWNYPTVKSILENYSKNNFSIIIISNQGGMSQGKQTFEVWSDKLNQICTDLQLEMYVFCATDHNKYRKPYPTWFNTLVPTDIRENLDRTQSFYCGDACGRKGDFADTDYKFALNCMVKFKVPESLFLGQYVKVPPIVYPKLDNFSDNTQLKFVPKQKEMIIMVGYQGSGKSYISKKLQTEFNYVVINQDTLKDKAKCVAITNNTLQSGHSIVIDRTNPDIASRKEWINLAKKYGYTTRVILMTTSKELSKHNNYFRHLACESIPIVPEIAYRMYKGKFKKPTTEEGFDEIIEMTCGVPKNNLYFLFMY